MPGDSERTSGRIALSEVIESQTPLAESPPGIVTGRGVGAGIAIADPRWVLILPPFWLAEVSGGSLVFRLSLICTHRRNTT